MIRGHEIDPVIMEFTKELDEHRAEWRRKEYQISKEGLKRYKEIIHKAVNCVDSEITNVAYNFDDVGHKDFGIIAIEGKDMVFEDPSKIADVMDMVDGAFDIMFAFDDDLIRIEFSCEFAEEEK